MKRRRLLGRPLLGGSHDTAGIATFGPPLVGLVPDQGHLKPHIVHCDYVRPQIPELMSHRPAVCPFFVEPHVT